MLINPETPWSAKPFAILSSSFREIIFIDADAYFFTDPTHLFDTQEYRKTGTVFFKDRTLFPRERREWLSGRYVDCRWDVEALLAKKQEILDGDKLKVNLIV